MRIVPENVMPPTMGTRGWQSCVGIKLPYPRAPHGRVEPRGSLVLGVSVNTNMIQDKYKKVSNF